MGGIIALIIICAILVIALVLNRPASTKEKKNPSEELSLVDKMRKEKEQEKPSSPEEHATENEFEDEQSDATENEFGDERPDAVTKSAKLFLKDKALVIEHINWISGGFRSRWVRINLEDIVRVVDEEGSPGNVFTRTFYPESLKIETENEVLDIGSSQHDYYEYMDPGSGFYIYTKDGQYELYYDKKDVNTIWSWILDYFRFVVMTREELKTMPDRTETFGGGCCVSVRNGGFSYWARKNRFIWNVDAYELMKALNVETLDDFFKVINERFSYDTLMEFLKENNIHFTE